MTPSPDHDNDHAEQAPTVIFLHIGKTGGTTLRKILHRNYRRSDILLVRSPKREDDLRPRREDSLRDLAKVPESERARVRVVEGHMIFGPHRLIPKPSTYITMLRKPVSLAISQYHYALRRPGHRLHDIVTSEGMSLEEYVRSGVSLEVDNSQTRAIAGDTVTPFGECTDDMLQQAKHNIEEYFAVVGLTERFDESLVLLHKAFGWSRLTYVRAKVSPKRHRRSPIKESTQRLLEDQNRFDIELYEFAARRLQAAMDAVPDFGRDLARFRKANALYRPWGTVTYSIPQRVRSKLRGQEE